MSKKPDDRPQTAGDVAARLTEWLAERGRKLGGGRIEGKEEGSGVGSGIFTPLLARAGNACARRGFVRSSRPISVSGRDRDTKQLNETGSSPATEEEIGLAPLEEEAGKAKRSRQDFDGERR